MNIGDAQRDLRRAYVGGGPGLFVSALVWFTAAAVERGHGIREAFVVLFLGGMLIFPLATLASRLLFHRKKEASENPLGKLALESTIAMIGGLFAAWLILPHRPDFVFPLAAIAVGTHYAVFKTVYGEPLFWVVGALITGVGFITIHEVVAVPGGPVMAVGAIELLFAVLLTWRGLKVERLST
jgi:hypothetical protein